MEKNTKTKKSTQTDDYKKQAKKTTQVGPNEFEETRSDKIRMKPQPLHQRDKK